MTLTDIISLAKISHLGSYHLKNDDTTMITLLNASLGQVYLRIPVLTKEHRLVVKLGISRYAYDMGAYKILSAKADDGTNISINNDSSDTSIFDVGNHYLDIPKSIQCMTPSITLLYHMRPPTVNPSNIAQLNFLPDDALVSSILAYMAYMAGKNISEGNGVGNYQEYQQQIDEVKRLGLYNTYSYSTTSNFVSSGWV